MHSAHSYPPSHYKRAPPPAITGVPPFIHCPPTTHTHTALATNNTVPLRYCQICQSTVEPLIYDPPHERPPAIYDHISYNGW